MRCVLLRVRVYSRGPEFSGRYLALLKEKDEFGQTLVLLEASAAMINTSAATHIRG